MNFPSLLRYQLPFSVFSSARRTIVKLNNSLLEDYKGFLIPETHLQMCAVSKCNLICCGLAEADRDRKGEGSVRNDL